MKFRLVAHTPFGSSLKSLPKPISVDIVTTLNDIHSLNLSYPTGQTNIENLWNKETQQQSEVSLEFFNETTKKWEEPLGCRFILMKHNHDAVEELPIEKFTMLSNKWLFRKAKVWDDHTDKDADGRQVYRDMTIGKMLRLLLTYAYNRGWLLGNPTNLGFTDTHDSGGIAWRGTHTRAFEPTMSLDAVMADLVEQGIIDWDIQGRKIMVFQEGTPTGLARNNRAIELMNVDDVTSSPEETSFDNVMTVARVIGDKNLSWVFENGSTSPFGRMEDVVSQAGVTDPITAREVTEKILEEGKKPRKTHTKEFAGSSEVQPFRDIRIGDWVTAHTRDLRGNFKPEEMRIQVISLKIDADGYTWNVDLGDKQADALARIAKKQRSINNGASSGTSVPGTGGQTSGDWRIPTAPYGVSVIASTHFDEDAKVYKGRWVVNWSDDGLGTDPYTQEKSPQRRSAYELEYRVKGTTQWIPKSVLPESNRQAIIYPIDVLNPTTKKPYEYEIRMRTKGLEDYSAYSSVVPVTMVPDTTPPGVPAINVVSDKGVFTVTWPGTFTDGSSVPSDFRSIKVEVADTTTGPWRDLGSIYDPTGGVLTLSGVPSGEARYFRAWSTDRSGNPSTYSPIVDAIGTTLVDIQNISNDILDQVADDLSELDTELKRAFGDQIKEATDQTLVDAAADAQAKFDVVKALADAAQTAADKNRETTEAALQEVARVAGTTGRVWAQDEPPEAGATYSWTGAPQTSASVKKIDGSEVARNLLTRPTLATSGLLGQGDTLPLIEFGATPPKPIFDDGKVTRVVIPTGVHGFAGTRIKSDGLNVAREQTYSYSIWVYGAGDNAYIYPTGTWGLPRMVLVEGSADGWGRYATTATVPAPAGNASESIYAYRIAPTAPDLEMWVGRAMVTEGDQLIPYFDGDTPDDRANDLWIDTDNGNLPHRWVKGTGWVATQDQAIQAAATAASNAQSAAADAQEAADAAKAAADTAQAGADAAHTAAGDAADLAVSAMNSASAANDSVDALASEAVVETTIQYALGSESTAPTSGWSSNTPSRTPGTYIWMRTIVKYGNGSTDTLSPALVTGNDGAKGDKGDTGPRGLEGLQGPKGDQGVKGVDGTSSYTHIAYANSANGVTDFSTSDSNRTYIGIATSSSPNDPTVPSAYQWSLIKGLDGAQGVPGKAGADGKTPYLHIAYATNSTGTAGFSTTDSVGKTYIGQYTDFVAADSTNPALYSWTLIKGDKGAQGVSVTSITPYYMVLPAASAKPAKPTTSTPSGWSTTEPSFVEETKLWRTDKITYSTGSFDYTDVSLSAAYMAASDAKNHADNLPKVLHGTTAPSGVAPNGSIWFQHRGSISGEVIAQWNRVSGSWVSTPIASEAIANLDVGKLTAGSADISTLVANKLFANIFAANKITAKEMIISNGNLFPDPNFENPSGYSPWTVVNGGIEKTGNGTQHGSYFTHTETTIEGDTEYILSFTRENITGSGGSVAVYAQYYVGSSWQSAFKLGETVEVGESSYRFSTPANATRIRYGFYTQATMTSATKVRVSKVRVMWPVGSTLIEPGAITADKITASSEMMTALLSAKKIEAEDVNVGSFWANQAWLGAAGASSLTLRQIIGDLITEVSGSGLTVNQKMVEADGTETLHPVISVGGGGSNSFTTRDPVTGETLASIGADGSVKATSLDSDTDPIVDGVPILGAVPTRHDSGEYVTGYLDGLSWGRVAYSWRDDHSSPLPGGETGILEVQFMAQPGRTYEITAETGGLVANGSLYYGRVRRMIGSSAFSSSSFIHAQTQWDSSGGGQHSIVMTSTTEGPADLDADPVDTRLLLCVYNPSGVQWTGNVNAKRAWIEVRDVGPRRGNTGTKRSVAISRTSGGSETEPTPVVVTKRTASWSGTSMRSYYSGGRQSSGKGSTMLKQGRDPYWTAGGLQSSMFLMNKSGITSTLAGATVSKATLTFKSAYASSGGSRTIRLYWHGATALGDSSAASDNYIGEYSIGDGATRTITLPSSVLSALKAGSVGGFAISPAGNTNSKYALGLSWTTRPKLTVEYSR